MHSIHQRRKEGRHTAECPCVECVFSPSLATLLKYILFTRAANTRFHLHISICASEEVGFSVNGLHARMEFSPEDDFDFQKNHTFICSKTWRVM